MIDGQSRNQLIGPARSKWSDIPGELVKPTAGAIVSALYCINLLDYHIGQARERAIAALVSRYGLDDVVRVVSHATILKRPVVDIDARSGEAQGREAPNTLLRSSRIAEVSRDV